MCFIAAVRSFLMRVRRGPPSQGIMWQCHCTYFAAATDQNFHASATIIVSVLYSLGPAMAATSETAPSRPNPPLRRVGGRCP
jgi:hypothetical protein